MTFSVLYVDDEPDLREIATMALELDPGMTVRTCASGPEALELLSNWTPDLVLLDMMMPGMDGIATYAAIREGFGEDIAIVYITARTEATEVERLKALGAKGVIAKPFDPMTLAAQVRAYLDRDR